ncbi:MAG: universal stress protein [Acidobacteria bacterium]|jgi:nucleotide-binding universal stress UspA family protein|nr:MAG: universal stress protein [Acidobacteriota bacterium]
MDLLVPVDFTEITNPLLRIAKTLGEAHKACIYLLHTISPVLYLPYPESFGMSVVDLELLAQLQRAKEAEAKEKLKGLAKFLEPLKVELFVEIGDPAESILEKEKLADLILMGSHRKGLVERILVGSTTEKVVKYTKKPVLIVKGREPESFKNILVCYDFSEHAQRALDFTLDLFSPFNPKFTLLHIEETIELPLIEGLRDVVSQRYREEKLKHLDELRKNLTDRGFSTECIVYEAKSPAEGIRDFLKNRQDVDLVILGSRGLSGLKRVLLGTTSSELIKSLDLPMLIHRSFQ